jgi:hypothetical protein
MIVESQYRIIPDPKNPKLWAYESLSHHSLQQTVGGFRSAKLAKRAFTLAKRRGAGERQEGGA